MKGIFHCVLSRCLFWKVFYHLLLEHEPLILFQEESCWKRIAYSNIVFYFLSSPFVPQYVSLAIIPFMMLYSQSSECYLILWIFDYLMKSYIFLSPDKHCRSWSPSNWKWFSFLKKEVKLTFILIASLGSRAYCCPKI